MASGAAPQVALLLQNIAEQIALGIIHKGGL
jgi:hypothetical protein